MSIKVGINGFGRIGRLVFRAGINCDDIEFLGINDPGMTPDYMAYMLRYDTMQGKFEGDISWDEESITLNYNSGWEPVAPGGSGLHYMLGVGRMDDSGVPGMGKAVVYVKDLTILSADDGLFRIEVAWQEVSAHD